MNDALWLIAAFITLLTGMGWFALSMQIHWEQVFNMTARKSPRWLLRIQGCVALLMSAVFCGIADHPSMAVLVWVLLLSAAAFVVAMLLSGYPVVLRILWPHTRMSKQQ